jgi:SDR family mycofactocin-dependent oxidoreductase
VFEDKVAFITGGARGIGREIALEFARHGADIVVCDIAADIASVPYPLATPDDLLETKRLVEAEGRRCVARIADVRDQRSLDEVVAAGVDAFGRLDAVVANAGIFDWSAKPLWETTDDAWRDQIGVCLEGVWRTAKAVGPQMIGQQSGSLVFVSSNSGVEGSACSAPYVAAKHGVCGLMRSAALEFGPYGVRVNAVLPSTTDTQINDHPVGWQRASGKPGAVRADYLDAVREWMLLRGTSALPPAATAKAVVWMCSDAAAYITGTTLAVDAGHLALPGRNLSPVQM